MKLLDFIGSFDHLPLAIGSIANFQLCEQKTIIVDKKKEIRDRIE